MTVYGEVSSVANIDLRKSKVAICENYIVIGKNKVRATFDLSELPEEHHKVALILIEQGYNKIQVSMPDVTIPPLKEKKQSWFKKLFSWPKV